MTNVERSAIGEEAPIARRRPARWSLLLPLPLAALLLFLASRGVDWGIVGTTLRRGRPDLLALSVLLMSGSSLARAVRWRVVLSAQETIALPTVYWATMAGYLGNSLLPARAGEVLRSVLLARNTPLSAGYVLATALVERILDALALVAISLLAIAALGTVPGWLVTATRVLGLLGVAGVAGFVLLPRLERGLLALLARLPLPGAIRPKLVAPLEQVLLGMRALQHAGRALRFLGLTVVVWLLDGLGAVMVGRAFDLPLTLPRAMLLLAALGLASAVPSTPGYVGVYQFVAVTVLVPLGFSRDQALAQIFGLQAMLYVVVLGWGAIGLWRLTGGPALLRRVRSPLPPSSAPEAAER